VLFIRDRPIRVFSTNSSTLEPESPQDPQVGDKRRWTACSIHRAIGFARYLDGDAVHCSSGFPFRRANRSVGVSKCCSFRTLLITRSRLQSITSSSSGSSSDSGSPLGRPIPLHCSAEDVCELTFSKSKILYVISKPRDTRSIQENALTVFAWNIIDGRRLALQPVIISHKVSGLGTSFNPF
jgi:hypothetical protein